MAIISNGSLLDEDMSDISDWTDVSSGTAAISQVTFDGKSCMKFEGGNQPGEAKADRTLAEPGTRSVISLNLYCDTIGTRANNDFFDLYFRNGSTDLVIGFASDGLWVYDGAAYNEVGTDLVVQDTWQEWTFDLNWTAQTLDVYLGQALQASGVDFSYANTGTSGYWRFRGKAITTSDTLSYVDWIKIGDDFESAATHTQSIIIT